MWLNINFKFWTLQEQLSVSNFQILDIKIKKNFKLFQNVKFKYWIHSSFFIQTHTFSTTYWKNNPKLYTPIYIYIISQNILNIICLENYDEYLVKISSIGIYSYLNHNKYLIKISVLMYHCKLESEWFNAKWFTKYAHPYFQKNYPINNFVYNKVVV